MGQRALNFLHWGWLAAMLLAGLLLRTCHLSYPALSIDEAESCINAMSILERGYPAAEYLGLPIFENTLVRPWPGGHQEYEFKDISYSDRGVAIYHGWLPLYAIAGCYWLAGIEPDIPTDPPRVQTTADDIWSRTVAARLPAVLFGISLIIMTYLAGRIMAGRDAGLIAATIAALAPPTVRVAREARYYSATHLLSLLCCLLLWQMVRRGRWIDFAAGGIAYALMFHTHSVSFVIAILLWIACIPLMLRAPKTPAKLGLFLGILVAAILPWALATGYPGQTTAVPAARDLLEFPHDYVAYLVQHWKLTAVLLATALCLGVVYLLRRRLPERVVSPLLASRWPMTLLFAWLVTGYLTFLLIVPAPSAFLWRLTLAIHGQGIVLFAILAASAARALGPRIGSAIPVLLGSALLVLPAVHRPLRSPPQWNQPVYGAIDYLRGQEFEPGTRLYATPLHHLTLSLLSGMPVQSTAPVHKRFFDEYAGNIVILETAHRGRRVDEDAIRAAGDAVGIALSDTESSDWGWRLSSRPLRQELLARGARPEPPLEDLPPFLLTLAEDLERRGPPREDDDGRWDNPAMFRGYETADKWGFWQVFFYRFVDPPSRMNEKLNYAARIRGARAVVLESTWVLFRAPPRTGGAGTRTAEPAPPPAVPFTHRTEQSTPP